MSSDIPNDLPRSRRSGDEVRSQLLQAALEVFAERGYGGASTKEVSQRAGVAEVLLFRHFGNKAGLFDEAVLARFDRFVDTYGSKWAAHQTGEKSPEELAREFIDILYGLFEEHRLVVEAMLAARSHLETVAENLNANFDRLQTVAAEALAEFGLPVDNASMAARLTFGLVMTAALHGDIIFPAGQPLPREKIVDELTALMLHGTTGGYDTHLHLHIWAKPE